MENVQTTPEEIKKDEPPKTVTKTKREKITKTHTS